MVSRERDLGFEDGSTFVIKRLFFQDDEQPEIKVDKLATDPFGPQSDDDGELRWFKRFRIRGYVERGEERVTFTLLVSLRGGYLQVMSDDRERLSPLAITLALNHLAIRSTFPEKVFHAGGETEILPMRLFYGDREHDKVALSKLRDPYAFLDLLHHTRDVGGFTRKGNLVPR